MRQGVFGVLVGGVILSLILLAPALFGHSYSGYSSFFAESERDNSMTVYHIVGFRTTDHAALAPITKGMFGLKELCTRDGHPYIRSISGGKQTNHEGHDNGIQVVFLVEFDNQEDVDYYINQDPAHVAFKDEIEQYGITGVTVLDFTPGAF